jgi:hypothetical protein
MFAEKQCNWSFKKNLPGKNYLSNPKKDARFKEICNEYSLKRNNFNPNSNSSPNIFINKLKKRFNTYYELQ